MKVSLSWLREYVSIEIPVLDLANALTMAGLEVEAILERYAYLDSVLAARVTEIEPHPNADRLKVCKVDTGHCSYSIVCGAFNLQSGMMVPLALIGTQLPDGSTLKESQIRGITSEGMLLSEAELQLGPDHSGIMSLDDKLPLGTPINKALNLSDSVFEIGLTPNRPDCLSMIGVAREIGALLNTSIRLPEFQVKETDVFIDDFTSVTIDAKDHCPRYAARLLTELSVGPSPFWLQNRLLSVGQRPINNIVDITNFVMLEIGQPLHAFDFDQLDDYKIIVRTAKEGEQFTTLDQKTRELHQDMLMICDGKKPVAIAGVMGGLNSEVEDKTSKVLLESAYFSPSSIRKTSKRLGLSTEASYRFERGVDPLKTLSALNRAAQLMVQLCGGRLVKNAIDQRTDITLTPPINLNVAQTNNRLGLSLSQQQIEELLVPVGFGVTKIDKDTLKIAVPSFRVDVSRPEDIMEEVARLEGYNTILTTFPKIPAKGRKESPLLTQRQHICDTLVGFGFNEVVNYSFVSRFSCDHLRLPKEDIRRHQVEVLNPLTEDQVVMRSSLIPGLLEVMRRNLSKQMTIVKIFETGRIFIEQEGEQLPMEDEMLSGLWSGLREEPSWHIKNKPCDFYDLKGVLEGLFDALNLRPVTFSRIKQQHCYYTRYGFSAQIYCQGRILGMIGEVHPDVLNVYDLRQPAYVFELNLNHLLALLPKHIATHAIPRFPFTTRDITLIVEQQLEAAKVITTIEKLDEPLIESIYIFDIFSGKPIPMGKKSISIRVTYRSAETTLIDEDVNKIHQDLTNNLLNMFKASLPNV
jgi:phenylalanyl-tRNA synthetase beta chain